MANEAKQLTIGGVTHDVMDVGARQAIASLQNTIDAITSGDTTTAIKTFQEVIDFLDGVTDDATLIGKLNELRTLIAAKYSKPASGIPASDLADGVIPDVSGFATKTEVNAKANSADVVPNSRTINGKALSSNVTIGMSDIQGLETAIGEAGKVKSVSVNGGTAQAPDGNGNVNVSVPTLTLDDAPTAGSNNAVKSGGIKTALDVKANAADVPTKTEMSYAIDDALGEAQVTVVPAGSIGVIDSMGSDSTTDALSANMGKRFKAALLILMGSIGNYAFPNGRPNLPLDGSASVTFNVSYISNPNVSYGSNPPTEVELLGRLEVSISVVSNLYIMDVDNMKVYMGGVPQEDVYNAATGKITINQVVGDVVIVPALMSYVDADGAGNKLAFMLDCKNGLTLDGNGVPTKWEDTIGGIEFDLSNVTIGSDGALVFNGNNAKGISASAGLSVGYNNATIEAVIEMPPSSIDATNRYPILSNTLDASAGARFGTTTSGFGFMGCSTNYGNMSQIGGRWDTSFFFDKTNKTFASTRTDVVVDGYEVLNPRKKPSSEGGYDANDYLSGKSRVFGVGYAQFSNSEQFFLGEILAIRVYRTQLTVDEMKYNHEIDKKRFNLQ